MAEKLQPLDITDDSDLRRLVEEVVAAEQPRVLQVHREDVAILLPVVQRGAGAAGRRGRRTDADDPLWNIVGIGQSSGSGDVAENVDAYLAEAYTANEA